MTKKTIRILVATCGIVAIALLTTMQRPSRFSWASSQLKSGNLIGKPRNHVDQFLGTPANPSGYFAGWDSVYWLRADASYLDNEWLVIKCDDNGVILDARIITD